MKRLITICTILSILIFSNANAQEKLKDKDDKTKMEHKDMKHEMTHSEHMNMSSLPYTANYSSNFIIGNADHAKMILDLWKDWDDNDLDRHDYMADTLVMILPDGQVIQGKEANEEGAKKYRGGFKSVKSTLDAWIPLKSVDKNENWVAIWGQEESVATDGKTGKREIHEVWRINKDGKVDYMKQWAATPAPPPPAR